MKNTLWVFGDSFAQDINERKFIHTGTDHTTVKWFSNQVNQYHLNMQKSWTWKLANNLNLEIKNFGISGSSIEYSAQKYTENFSNFVDGDVVIFAVTQMTRKYLVDSSPSWTTSWQIENIEIDGFTQNDIDFYKRVLVENGNRPNSTILSLLLHSSAVLKNKNIKFVFIPCFSDVEYKIKSHIEKFPESINETNGNLFQNVSNPEFELPIRKLGSQQKRDKRYNHMHMANHEILANKLTDCIVNNIPLDLVNGFIQNIFDDLPTEKNNGF